MKVFGALLLVGTWLSGSAGQEIVRYRCKADNRCKRLDECIKETMGAGYTCKMGPGAGIVVNPVGSEILNNFCGVDDDGSEYTNRLFTGCEAFVEPPVAQVDAVVRFCRTSDCTDSSAQSKCIEAKYSNKRCVASWKVLSCTSDEVTLATCGPDAQETQTFKVGACTHFFGEYFYEAACATASPEIVSYRCKAANRCERLDECIKETMGAGYTCKKGPGAGIVVNPVNTEIANNFCSIDDDGTEYTNRLFTGCEAFVEPPVAQVDAVVRFCRTSDCTDSSAQSKCMEMKFSKSACAGSQVVAACTSEKLTLATCGPDAQVTQTFKVGTCTDFSRDGEFFYEASCGGGDNGNSGPSGDNGNSAAASLAALRGKY